MQDTNVYKDENGEYVLMPSGPKGNRQFTKVYFDELGYDPRDIKCKNCGAPIEKVSWTWRHIRDVHTGRIWCFPTSDQKSQDFSRAAEPEE